MKSQQMIWRIPLPSNDMTLSRRGLILGATAAAALPLPAFAVNTSQATQLVDTVIKEIMGVVNSSASEGRALSAFEKTLSRHSDMGLIARSVLGQPWRSASSGQQKAFTSAFQAYVARKYGREFRAYKGSEINILTATDRGKKGILVNTRVRVPGSAPILVDWQVIDRGGRAKVFDLLIEGISMVGTERVEVRSILEANRNNLDATIKALGGKR